MNTCDYIIETLYLNGIDTYFVITGGAIVPFINAIARNPKVKYYCFQHEQSAAMAAEGYYRASGKQRVLSSRVVQVSKTFLMVYVDAGMIRFPHFLLVDR